jgi:uncharacterized protein (DUF2252 family)
MVVDAVEVERASEGRHLRRSVARSSQAVWEPALRTADPIDLLAEQAQTRIPQLVPIRHGRMLVSPFAYFRGAALAMASDLAGTPTTGLQVQLCGDAHLSNFGIFGTPERRLVFDLNDFDETARGPWEWDVKRLAASLEIAGRENGLRRRQRRTVVGHSVRSYREAMRGFATMSMLDVWYANLDMDALLPRFQASLDPRRTPNVWRAIAKARAHDSMQAFDKLCTSVDGVPRIASHPPLIVPIEELSEQEGPEFGLEDLRERGRAYRESIPPDRQHLLEGYRMTHLARKVVGVGSVGTDTWIALLLDQDHESPLLLQIKEAKPSVLERYTAPSPFSNQGRRVVVGQRLMQAASDIFLGWERRRPDAPGLDYYVRQLRDWKGSADVPGMTRAGLQLWGTMCGWTLARAHARSGDRVAIASYLGRADVFDRAVAEFAGAYADQNERDYGRMQAAVADGRLPALAGI